jgi:nucleotide-binding universal stress UspA family protein
VTIRILAITDLSPTGDLAVLEAHRRARALGGTLGVAHAVPTLEAVRPLFPHRLADDAIAAAELPARAEAELRRRVDGLGSDVPVEVFVARGTTADVALRIVDDWKPETLVIGAPDDGAIDALRVVRHATIPVLVVRQSPNTGRIVAGTDLSDPSFPAIRAGAEEAKRVAGELIVVHAVEPLPFTLYGGEPMAIVLPTGVERRDEVIVRLGETLKRIDVSGKAVVHDAPPADALVRMATELEIELLVIGTHGRTGLTRFLLGSVAETVIRKAPCSVLVVRLRS